jgi:hypothetical protein
VFGQASNILKRQGGYVFIDGIRILSWIDEPQMIEFQNLRSSMQANLFTMKIRSVNPKFQHNYDETYGTGTTPLSGEIPSIDRLSQESSQPDGRVQVLQDSKHTDDSFRGKSNS